ncbi:Lrp Transcriptional regulators [Burkholderiales bacterium]|jgi:Lrp/AsnC family leucine-responsive transcriptional regulator
MTQQSTKSFDAIDLKILDQLQIDASLSNVELARRVHLSPSPCLARVRALEARGLIRQYVALLEAKHLGLHLNVFISISLKLQSRQALQEFEERITLRDEVILKKSNTLRSSRDPSPSNPKKRCLLRRNSSIK